MIKTFILANCTKKIIKATKMMHTHICNTIYNYIQVTIVSDMFKSIVLKLFTQHYTTITQYRIKHDDHYAQKLIVRSPMPPILQTQPLRLLVRDCSLPRLY